MSTSSHFAMEARSPINQIDRCRVCFRKSRSRDMIPATPVLGGEPGCPLNNQTHLAMIRPEQKEGRIKCTRGSGQNKRSSLVTQVSWSRRRAGCSADGPLPNEGHESWRWLAPSGGFRKWVPTIAELALNMKGRIGSLDMSVEPQT